LKLKKNISELTFLRIDLQHQLFIEGLTGGKGDGGAVSWHKNNFLGFQQVSKIIKSKTFLLIKLNMKISR